MVSEVGLQSHLKAWLGLEDLLQVTHSHGCWQDDAGQWQEASVPLHIDVPLGLLEHPHNMVTGFPQSK